MSDDRGRPEVAGSIYDAWTRRRRGGQGEDFEALLARHPEFADELRGLHAIHTNLADELRDLHAIHAGRASGEPGEAEGPPVPDAQAGETLPGLPEDGQIGDYRILREIGRGGMGVVYEAEQVSLHRRVALKVLPASLTLNARALARFRREAEITGRLHHRGIVEVHQIGEHRGIHYIAMELVEGSSLDRVIERMRGESFESIRRRTLRDVISLHGLQERRKSKGDSRRGSGSRKSGSSSAWNRGYVESSVKLICQVADALQHAHDAGVIHRDVKPSNILLRGNGSAVLTDFGLARDQGLPSVSVTGDFAGTPHYVSPEQAMSGRVPVDHRSDVFSLGATMYELLTLERAFPGHNTHEVLRRILTKPPVPPQRLNPALAPDLVTILLKALEKDPDQRYSSAAELADDLRAFIEYRPIKARRTPTVVRVWRWVRREPLKAAILSLLAVGLPLTGWLASELFQEREARAAREAVEGIDQGFLRLGVGLPAEAIAHFEGALARAPDSGEAAAGLALAYLALDDPQAALACLDDCERNRGGRAFAGLLRAEVLERLGRHDEAESLRRRTSEPTEPIELYIEAVRRLSGHPFLLGVPESASPSFGPRAGHRVDNPAMGPGDATVSFREEAEEAAHLLRNASKKGGRALYDFALCHAAWVARDVSLAEEVSARVSERYPASPVAWCYVGFARELFDLEGAARAFAEASAQARKKGLDLPIATARLGILHTALGEVDRSIALLEEAVETARRPSFLDGLAEAYLAGGRTEDALRTVRESISIAPARPASRDILVRTLYGSGDVNGARDALLEAIERFPDYARFHCDLGWVLVETGEFDTGMKHLEEARRLDPENPFVLFNLGVVQRLSGDSRRAIAFLEEALERVDEARYPGFPTDQAWDALGGCYELQGDPQRAIEIFRGAIALAPDDPAHHANLGGALIRTGRVTEGARQLETAVEHGMQSPAVFRLLARTWMDLGEAARSLEVCRKWTDAFPEDATAWNARAWAQVAPGQASPVGSPSDAVYSAKRANELAERPEPGFLETLARALWRNGETDEALDQAYRALELAEERGLDSLLPALERTIDEFEAALDG